MTNKPDTGYANWPNKATWSVFTIFTSYEESRVHVEKIARTGELESATNALQHWVQSEITRWWIKGRTQYQQPITSFMKDTVKSSIYQIDWWKLYDGLKNEQETIESDDELTQNAFTFYRSIQWIALLQEDDDEHMITGPEAMLSDALEEQIENWIEIIALRKKGGPLAVYNRKAYTLSMKVIDWRRITLALRGE